jgi:drug/metabolite transporter (DMT)-like permease
MINITDPNERKGIFYAILSGFFYGFLGYFGTNVINENISIYTMTFWRFFASGVFVGGILLWQIKTIHESWREFMKVLFAGTVFYTGCANFYFSACEHLGTGLSMVIMFTFPIFVMLSNWFFDHMHIPKIYYYSIALILFGMMFLIDTSKLSVDMLGVFLALLAAICYAGYVVLSKKSSLSPPVALFAVSVGCSIASFIIALLHNSFMVPHTLTAWANILGIGIVSTAIPILLLLASLKYTASEKTSILAVLKPVFVVIFGVLFLGETMTFFHILGIIIVLTGAFMTAIHQEHTKAAVKK